MNEDDLKTAMVYAEFGYKGCEKGWNLERTMHELQRIVLMEENNETPTTHL